MLKRCLLFLIIAALLPSVGWGVEVAESAITSGVEMRQPVDSLSSVSADIGKVYCFTRMTGAGEDVGVSHVWFWKGEEMAQVDLMVRSNNWRTWSSKRILPEWTGEWIVSVRDAAGIELSTVSFIVE